MAAKGQLIQGTASRSSEIWGCPSHAVDISVITFTEEHPLRGLTLHSELYERNFHLLNISIRRVVH